MNEKTHNNHNADNGPTAEDERLELSNALWEEARRSEDALVDVEIAAERQERADTPAA
jgi:hypothetical protein